MFGLVGAVATETVAGNRAGPPVPAQLFASTWTRVSHFLNTGVLSRENGIRHAGSGSSSSYQPRSPRSAPSPKFPLFVPKTAAGMAEQRTAK